MTNFEVTHFTPTNPEHDLFVPLRFLTRVVGDETSHYHVGFQAYKITASEVAQMEQQGSVLRLRQPESIARDQGLWLSPENKIWLAKAERPVDDANKKQLFATKSM